MKEFRSSVTPSLNQSYASQSEKQNKKDMAIGGRYCRVRLLSWNPIRFHLINDLNADTIRVEHMSTIVASDMQSMNTRHSIAHVYDNEYPPVI